MNFCFHKNIKFALFGLVWFNRALIEEFKWTIHDRVVDGPGFDSHDGRKTFLLDSMDVVG